MKNKKAKKGNSLILILLLAIIGIGAYFYFTNQNTDQPLLSVLMYDKNGNPINTNNQFSIVNSIPNVASIAFKIAPCNLDAIPLTFSISSFTSNPTNSLTTSLKPTNSITINPNSCGSFITPQLVVSSYEGYNTRFCVDITTDEIANVRNSLTKNSCVDVNIISDSRGTATNPNYNITVITNTGGGSNICVENWQCGSWTTCSSGTQTRSCGDLNNCGTINNKPALSQSCTSSVNFAYSGNCALGFDLAGYARSGCIISVNTLGDGVIKTYTYNGAGIFTTSNIAPQYWGNVLPFTATGNLVIVYDQTIVPNKGIRIFSSNLQNQAIFT
jgi:hypothetical protein